jgi:hypothetical protein
MKKYIIITAIILLVLVIIGSMAEIYKKFQADGKRLRELSSIITNSPYRAARETQQINTPHPAVATSSLGHSSSSSALKIPVPTSTAERYHPSLIELPGSVKVNEPPASINNTSTPKSTIVSQGCRVLPYQGKIDINQVPNYKDGTVKADFRGGIACKYMINPGLPVFDFNFIGQPDDMLEKIEVTEEGSAKIIQTLNFSGGTEFIGANSSGNNLLAAVDANYDGYQDLEILNNCGQNCSYDFYLYDPVKREFVENEFLEGFGNPEFDLAKKQIAGSWTLSAGEYYQDTYQFFDGQYFLIQSIVSTDTEITSSTYSIIDGKSRLIKSTTTPWEYPE